MFGVHDVNGRDFSNRKVLSRLNLNPSHATLQYAKAWTSLQLEMKIDMYYHLLKVADAFKQNMSPRTF